MNYRQRIIILGLFDAMIVTLALIVAYLLRFEFRIPQTFITYLPHVVITFVIIIFITFNCFKLYRRIWQYASLEELLSLIKAVTISEISFILIYYVLQRDMPNFIVPRSIFILSWVLIIGGVGGSRFAWRIFRDSYMTIKPHHRRTLIVGAGKAGTLIAKELKHALESEVYPVAFIDDDRSIWGLEVMGLPVLGGREHIPEVVEKHNIQKIIIAIPSAPKREISKIINICKITNAKIKILPRVADLISGKLSLKMIREVSLEDLLGRESVQVDLDGIAKYLTNQVVLVTGAGGSIGSELCRQISALNPKKLLLLGHGENSIYDIELELIKSHPGLMVETIIADVQDRRRIKNVFNTFRPNLVFHAAAHKHVPLMEKNPEEAIKNNILGTRNVAESAHEYRASCFVMISTDKAVNPTSVMGVTKRVAEMIVQGLARVSNTKFVAVRFGNVLGSRGSVIPLFKQQISDGGPVTVTHPDMVRYFMTIPEAVQLVIQAGALAKGGEIFVLDMGKPVKIKDLARDLIRLSGYEPDKDIKITYTGSRPGEKLFEEILTIEEGVKTTKHNCIFVGKPLEFSWVELKFLIKKLEQVVFKSDAINVQIEIKELLRQIVPTYKIDSELTNTAEQSINLGNYTQRERIIQEIIQSKQETATSKEGRNK